MTFEAGRLSRFTAAGIITGLTLVASMLFGTCALAQPWPNKPVRVVIPWPPGGTNDIVGRAVVQRMGTQLGTAFVVENRAGAAGTIGAAVVAAASGDGYTLMVHSATHLSNASTYKSLPYRTIEDFTPLAFLSGQPWVLVVHPSLPVKTLPELIKLAKSRPGQINYASVGPGSPNHMGMELLKSMAGIDMVHIPYKGTAPAITDVISGQVSLLFNSMPSVLQHIKSGRLRALAVGSAKRSPAAPDVPTVSETAGLKDFQYTTWYALHAPAATPKEVIARINADSVKALGQPDMAELLASQGAEPAPSTPEGLAKFMRAEYEDWRKVIKAANLSLQ